jgi:hypothetical protein
MYSGNLMSLKEMREIYYLSKTFTDYESKYTMVEKFCSALVWVTK